MGNFHKDFTNYQIIPRELIFDSNLSDRARFIYCYMASKPDDWDFFLTPMSKEIGYSVDTLRKYITELVNSGWLIKGKQRLENGRWGAVEYTLKGEKDSTETETNNDNKGEKKPCTEKPDTVKEGHGKNTTQHNRDYIQNRDYKEKRDFSFLEKNEKNDDFSFPPNPCENANYVSDNMRQCWTEWTDYLKRKRIYDDVVVRKQYPMLIEYSHNDATAAQKIIDFAIMGQYRMFAPLSEDMLTQIVGETSGVATKQNVVWE